MQNFVPFQIQILWVYHWPIKHIYDGVRSKLMMGVTLLRPPLRDTYYTTFFRRQISLLFLLVRLQNEPIIHPAVPFPLPPSHTR